IVSTICLVGGCKTHCPRVSAFPHLATQGCGPAVLGSARQRGGRHVAAGRLVGGLRINTAPFPGSNPPCPTSRILPPFPRPSPHRPAATPCAFLSAFPPPILHPSAFPSCMSTLGF